MEEKNCACCVIFCASFKICGFLIVSCRTLLFMLLANYRVISDRVGGNCLLNMCNSVTNGLAALKMISSYNSLVNSTSSKHSTVIYIKVIHLTKPLLITHFTGLARFAGSVYYLTHMRRADPLAITEFTVAQYGGKYKSLLAIVIMLHALITEVLGRLLSPIYQMHGCWWGKLNIEMRQKRVRSDNDISIGTCHF